MANTTTFRSLGLPTALTCLTLLAVAGCDSDEAHDEVVDALMASVDADQIGDLENDIFEIDSTPEEEETDLELQAPGEPELLARVERRTSSVEWRDGGEDSEVLLLIGGTADDLPLIDMDTAESLTPVEAWVAIADEPTVVPRGLLERATPADLALLEDAGQIESLRTEVREKLSQADQIQAQPLEPHAYGTCTSSQVAAARSVYGQAYSTASTCGDHLGFKTTARTYWYCNTVGGDCDYPLASSEQSCIPAVNNSAAVKGSLAGLSMRSKTSGNPTFVTGAHRIRGFAYNCHGNNSLNLHMEYGSWNWNKLVASGYYSGVVTMSAHNLPAKAMAIDYVSYASWDNGISASGPNYKTSELSITNNTAAGDFGIFCADTQKSLSMSAGSTGNQHSWCTGSCNVGNCWD